MARYLNNIAGAFSTIFEGLAITASHILRKPITVQYPDKTLSPVKEMVGARYRGFLKVGTNICTACTLCMQACPIGCIDIGITKSVVGRQSIEKSSVVSRQSSASSATDDQRPTTENKTAEPVISVAQRLISKFDIDIGKCMFCGLCVEACPTGAIHFTREFEKAVGSLDELVFRFVEEGKAVIPYKKSSA